MASFHRHLRLYRCLFHLYLCLISTFNLLLVSCWFIFVSILHDLALSPSCWALSQFNLWARFIITIDPSICGFFSSSPFVNFYLAPSFSVKNIFIKKRWIRWANLTHQIGELGWKISGSPNIIAWVSQFEWVTMSGWPTLTTLVKMY